MDLVSIELILLLFLVWYWIIEYWIDIPNIETVNLPGSFRYVESKSMTSIYINNNEWIDISTILEDLVPFTPSDIEKLDSNITSIIIPNYSMNNETYMTFNFSRFKLIEELIIGDNCFSNVELFNIDGLNHLKSIKIGKNSFTHLKSGDKWDNKKANNRNRSFSILNCDKLESIEIGYHSFSDYGGGFELKNLPKLSTIKIGEIGNDSSNFYYSSFVIKGILDIYW